MKLRSTVLLVALIAAAAAAPAGANVGYELALSNSYKTLSGPPRGIAVDQANHDIYVAIVTKSSGIGTPGEIKRFNNDLSADGTFGSAFYTGVAVNPVTHDFYASQVKFDLALGSFGTPKIERFSSAGALEGSFATPDAGSVPPIATDSTGRVFFPNSDGHKVEIFDSAGTLKEQITCSLCPGGAFGRPISVAVDSANNLYVADVSPDRVIKLSLSGGSYVYSSTIQSGRGAAAVAVDPSSGDILVGDVPGGRNYHIVAYNSSGTEFDDFGAGIFPDPPQEPAGASTNLAFQMAVDGTTHKLYVGADNKFYVFEKTTIDPPTATIKPASEVGQLVATMNASVNANGHAALECEFEYTLDTDVAFASATSLPCAQLPNGLGSTSLSLRLSGLSPQTAYRYRVATTTHAGSATSGSQTFETLPEVPPTVTTEAPTAVTQTSATLTGTANPHGGSVSSCRFEFGASLSYGTNLACSPSLGPVTTNVLTTRKLTVLKPGTTYHYRLVISTNAGAADGDDIEFVTLTPPPEPDPAEPGPSTSPTTPTGTTPTGVVPGPVIRPPLRCRKGFRKKRVRGKVRCVKRKPRKRGSRAHDRERDKRR